MNCFGCKGYGDKVGVLLAQLGTPRAPTPSALRTYLKQFLSDRRVIEVNRLLWWFILNGSVLRTRPARSAKAYSRIWQSDGSPLLTITKNQCQRLESELRQIAPVEVQFGMRYGEPSLEHALDELIEKGCARILLFPMYPQYAAATTASSYDMVFNHLLKRRWVPTLRVVAPYYHHAGYLKAVAAGIVESIEQSKAAGQPAPQKLLLSYHGIPLAYVQKGDPYCCMCTETTARLLPYLPFDASDVIHTYQSRFGKDPWLTPYTDVTIESVAKQGIKHLAVALPGFTADCLETLDELGNEGRHIFLENGGKTFTLIPCVNNSPVWIRAMRDIVVEELGSWIAKDSQAEKISCPVEVAVNA